MLAVFEHPDHTLNFLQYEKYDLSSMNISRAKISDMFLRLMV